MFNRFVIAWMPTLIVEKECLAIDRFVTRVKISTHISALKFSNVGPLKAKIKSTSSVLLPKRIFFGKCVFDYKFTYIGVEK